MYKVGDKALIIGTNSRVTVTEKQTVSGIVYVKDEFGRQYPMYCALIRLVTPLEELL